MDEFELIETLFAPLGKAHPSILVGIGDDGAVVSPQAGCNIVTSIDTLVSGVHFPGDIAPERLGYRALAVSLSDLAAMAATPCYVSLALTLPEVNTTWLKAFVAGIGTALAQYDCPLVGGNTTRGPLTISVHVTGEVAGHGLTRGGAVAGDRVFVSGSLGDAAAALAYLEASRPNQNIEALLERYYAPQARIGLALRLRPLASAAIDISDGLLADAGHLATSSGVALELDCAALPLSAALRAMCKPGDALRHAITGGDDYELLFTAPATHRDKIIALGDECGVAVSEIGRVRAGSEVRLLSTPQPQTAYAAGGYRHFS